VLGADTQGRPGIFRKLLDAPEWNFVASTEPLSEPLLEAAAVPRLDTLDENAVGVAWFDAGRGAEQRAQVELLGFNVNFDSATLLVHLGRQTLQLEFEPAIDVAPLTEEGGHFNGALLLPEGARASTNHAVREWADELFDGQSVLPVTVTVGPHLVRIDSRTGPASRRRRLTLLLRRSWPAKVSARPAQHHR